MSWLPERTHVVGELVDLRGQILQIIAVRRDRSVLVETVAGETLVVHAHDAATFRNPPDGAAGLFKRLHEELELNSISLRCQRVLDCWALILPARVVSEDLGDYLEDINRRARNGHRWRAYVRLVAAICWTGINAVGYTLRELWKTPMPRGGHMQITPTRELAKTVVVLPVACEECGTAFDMECSHSSGFGFMQPGWFRCQHCSRINRLAALPGEPLRITPRSR